MTKHAEKTTEDQASHAPVAQGATEASTSDQLDNVIRKIEAEPDSAGRHDALTNLKAVKEWLKQKR